MHAPRGTSRRSSRLGPVAGRGSLRRSPQLGLNEAHADQRGRDCVRRRSRGLDGRRGRPSAPFLAGLRRSKRSARLLRGQHPEDRALRLVQRRRWPTPGHPRAAENLAAGRSRVFGPPDGQVTPPGRGPANHDGFPRTSPARERLLRRPGELPREMPWAVGNTYFATCPPATRARAARRDNPRRVDRASRWHRARRCVVSSGTFPRPRTPSSDARRSGSRCAVGDDGAPASGADGALADGTPPRDNERDHARMQGTSDAGKRRLSHAGTGS
jgi:hypothetical protein